MRKARSRQDTRSAVLGHLWYSGGAFRPTLADVADLTEASVSRIIAELSAERLVEETRRTAPYQGGPSIFITLSKDVPIAALEISNNQIHVAVGTLAGDVLYSERHGLPDGLDASAVETVMVQATGELADWTRRRGAVLEQVAVSIPGYHVGRRGNPIVALDPVGLSRQIEARLPGTPITLANSMVSRAVAHRLQLGRPDFGKPYLFVFAGHGVGAAFVEDFTDRSGIVEPCEIGHMVVDPKGSCCRCGHTGCLETYVSTAALAEILKVQESDLIACGDRWFQEFRITSKARREIRERLIKLGLAIGNTLNARRYGGIVITGWPSTLPEEDRAAVLEALGQALLGGGEGIDLSFATASLGREPVSGLALSTFSFIQRGGMRLRPRDELAEA